MRGPRLAAGTAALMAAACLAGMATVASAAPSKASLATASSRSGIREVPPGKKYSTAKLGAVRQQSARARALAAPAAADTARRHRPPVARARRLQRDPVPQGLHACAASAPTSRSGSPTTSPSRPATAGRRIPTSTQITDAQVAHLITEFDTNMYPKETAAFSTPPDRDGSNALLGPDANGNGGVYTGGGDKTVTLVDNVRDDNYYTFPAAPTYIAGFFSSQFNELLDRNVMTIDAFDWAHRTGANPPDEPTTDLCTSRPARPNLYEGTFAHEWQHLLQYYTDPIETTWVNEGLSDFAQTLTGYVDATRDRVRPRAPTATSTASRASAPCRRRSTRTRATAAGRRTR